ncbi:MAG: hypothetical protein IPJ58_09505 [Ardenticatenia bacterium]|nr:hypothetical protein [Ardenticatenia bacterium]
MSIASPGSSPNPGPGSSPSPGSSPNPSSSPSLRAGPAPRPPRSSAARWLLLLALGLVAMAAVARCGGGAPVGRSDAALLGPADLSPEDPAAAARWQSLPAPVDLGQAELVARAAAGGKMPAAQARAAVSYRDAAGGVEFTQAVLRYADGAEAEAVVAAGAPLLERTFGLIRAPLDLPGTTGATAWHSAVYGGVSFIAEDTLVFVGGSGMDGATLSRLAAAARDRVQAARLTQAAGSTPSP